MDRDIFTQLRRRRPAEKVSVAAPVFTAAPHRPRGKKLPAKRMAATLKKLKTSRRAAMSGSLAFVLVLQLVCAAVLPSLINTDKFYNLSPKTTSLVGSVDDKLKQKLKYSTEAKAYQYNHQASGDPGSPEAALAAQQQSMKSGGGADNYSVDLPVDPTKGITVKDATDKSGSLAISLIPQFGARDGKLKDGRVIYPLKGIDGHLVYSVKGNGLKEDIILNEEQGDELNFIYKLQVPDSLEAKLLENGNIGIYSADTTLFGNISFGSDADREKVEAARKNSEKTNLVFSIPAPVVVQNGKGSDHVKSKFELKDDVLTVKTIGLKSASYPLSIDPTIAVTSASSFEKGNKDGMIEIDTANNQLKRSPLSGGSLGAWQYTYNGASSGSFVGGFSGGKLGPATVAYNNYLYLLGGYDGSVVRHEVYYAAINSNGTIGTWTATASMVSNVPRSGGVAAYNGYIYMIDGNLDSKVAYSKINTDGSLNAWSYSANNINATRSGNGAAAYNGYLYTYAGCRQFTTRCTWFDNTAEYAKINANGTLGAWHYTYNSIDNGTTDPGTGGGLGIRSSFGYDVYNGYLYAAGGCSGTTVSLPSCSSTQDSIQYAKLNEDGTIGSWQTALTGLPANVDTTFHRGYMYISMPVPARVYYSTVNADGSLGTLRQTGTPLGATNRYSPSLASHNGYIYILGGGDSGSYYNDVQIAAVDPVGSLGTTTVSNNTGTASAIYQHATVAYNGYLYILGGFAGMTNAVHYAAISSSGSIGAWASTTGMSYNAYGHGAVAYKGFMYVVGGCTAADNCVARTNTAIYAAINSNGTLSSWTNAASFLPEARAYFGYALYDNILYLAGGSTGSGFNYSDTVTTSVVYGTLSSSGGITAWATASNSLGDVRTTVGATVAAGRLYVNSGSSTVAATYVQSALICTGNNSGVEGCNATLGNLGTWRNETQTPTQRSYGLMYYEKGYIYIAGGSNGSAFSSVIYAKVNTDGTLGSWQTTQSLSRVNTQASGAVYNSILYVTAGGNGLGTTYDDTEILPINNGGSRFTSTVDEETNFSGINRTGSRSRAAAVAHNGYLYSIGGYGGDDETTGGNEDTTLNTVVYSQINPPTAANAGDSLTTWAPAGNGATLPAPVQYADAVVHDGYIYLTGGLLGTGLVQDIKYALICTGNNTGVGGCSSTPGTLGTWSNPNAGTPVAQAYYSGKSAVVGDYIYVMGGCSQYSGGCVAASNAVYYAQFNSNGTIGNWQTTSSFTTPRTGHVGFYTNGYIYIAGGCNNTCATRYSDVQFAKVNANGTLGSWQTANSLPAVRTEAVGVTANGYVYVIGGRGTSGAKEKTILTSTINANGTLGDWTTQTIQFVVTADGLDQSDGVVYDGYIYLLGGNDNTYGTSIDVQRFGLNSINRAGKYSQLIDLGSEGTVTDLIYGGSQFLNSIRFSYKNATCASGSGVLGSSVGGMVSKASTLISITKVEACYKLLTFELDDSLTGVFPNADSYTTTLSDFEVFFKAAPGKRMRGGKTFTNDTTLTSPKQLDAKPYQ
jgi:hypothetical protein